MNNSKQHEHLQQQFQPAATFNELLISEVRSHPQLYDQQHRVCTDNGERNAIWEVIASRIDDTVNGEFAKKRWLQMRDRYRKELKMALRTSIQPKWPYFNKLAWLDPYLKDAKNIKSVTVGGTHHQQPNALGATLTDLDNNSNHQIGAAFRGDVAEQLHFGNTISFLESLMAASNALLQQQTKGLAEPICDFSSTDSAEASTSEGGGDGGTAAEQRQSTLHNYHQTIHQNLLLRPSSNILMEGIGNDQSEIADQRSLTSSSSGDGQQEEKHDGNNDNKHGDEGGQGTTNQGIKCRTDISVGQSMCRRSASVSSPSDSADPSMELSLNALFAQSSPLRLLSSSLLNSATISVDNEYNQQKHQPPQQCNHRRALSATSKVSPDAPLMRYQRVTGTGGANGGNCLSYRSGSGINSQPPYLIRRGFGVSKYRGRFAGTSARKFDIASMCLSPLARTDALGGRDREIYGDGNTPTEDTTNNANSSNSNFWKSAMEWADDGGTANTTGINNNEDEDALFARLVVARLKKFDTKERRAVRSRIFHWLDQKEEEMDTTTTPSGTADDGQSVEHL